MIPMAVPSSVKPPSKPRASGDDPIAHNASFERINVNPARAGMIPNEHQPTYRPTRKPRASGDDPSVPASTHQGDE